MEIGAVIDGGQPIIVRNEDIIQRVGVSETEFKAICAAELAEIERQRERYLVTVPGSTSTAVLPLSSMTVLLRGRPRARH